MQRYIITGGHRATQSDLEVEPIVSFGKNRMDAVANSGITVWTEEEWEQAKRNLSPGYPNVSKVLFSLTREKCQQ